MKNVEFCHLHLEKPNKCAEHKSFYTNHFFIGANARQSVAAGLGSYVPVFLHEIPKLMRKGIMRPDVALLNVSPPDRHGYCSLGTEVATSLPAAQTAPLVIAQINPSMPRTHGATSIHYSSLDYVVEVDEPLPQRKVAVEPTEVEKAIGKHIAKLVPNGATLQMGIGAIPNAVLSQLGGHKDLGVHTEMFEEGVIDLIDKGVITNFSKKFLPGKIVTSFVAVRIESVSFHTMA